MLLQLSAQGINFLLSILHSLLLLLLCGEELLLQLHFERRGHDAATTTRDENENENENEHNSRHPSESLLHDEKDDDCHSDSTITGAKRVGFDGATRVQLAQASATVSGDDNECETRTRNH